MRFAETYFPQKTNQRRPVEGKNGGAAERGNDDDGGLDRMDLAQMLLESLAGDPPSDAEIKAELTSRLEALRSGQDAGLTFQQTFGTPA